MARPVNLLSSHSAQTGHHEPSALGLLSHPGKNGNGPACTRPDTGIDHPTSVMAVALPMAGAGTVVWSRMVRLSGNLVIYWSIPVFPKIALT